MKYLKSLLALLVLVGTPSLWSQVKVDTTFKGASAIAAHLLRLKAPAPNVRPGDLELRLDVNFNLDSDQLQSRGKAQLDTLADVLKRSEFVNTSIELAGHTCDIGNEHYNMELSRRRVDSTADYLIHTAGIAASRISRQAYGEELPLIVGAKNEEERTVNRRVVAYLPVNRSSLEEMLRQLPMSQGFCWAVFRYDKSGKATLVSYDGSSVLHSGDQYRVYMRPTRSKYVYLYQQDSKGNAAWIYPRTDLGLKNPMTAGEYYLPSRKKIFTLDGTQGAETLHLMVCDEPAPELERLVDQKELAMLPQVVHQTVLVRGLHQVTTSEVPAEGNANIKTQTVIVGSADQDSRKKEYRIENDPVTGGDILTMMAQHREFYMNLRFWHK